MYDTHAHLNFPELYSEIDKVVTNSQRAGLKGIIIASSNLEDSKKAVDLAKRYPGFLYASVGIHPQKTDPENKASVEEQLIELESLIKEEYHRYKNFYDYKFYKPVFKAIGETGLDFSEVPPGEEDRSKEDQYALFKGQIELALKYNLPLIVHARESYDAVLSILSNLSLSNLRGTFHCYAGGKKRIQKILDLDHADASHRTTKLPPFDTSPHWYFGFDGNLTYDQGLQEVIKLIPRDRILIETDSPFLAPTPHRGELNTPTNLIFIQQKINQILGHDLTGQIEENTKRLFGLS
ncbi:MAG: TatD family hydrolase [Patescibacteria group bacterium]|nr:TatD family hydrolase [Patescibacteria group bacterium]